MSQTTNKKDRILLIVDDEPDIRSILEDICQELTDKIKIAENGKVALEILSHERVDAVISDINMPQMTGLQLLASLRNQGNEVPFIILSGYGDKKNTLEALQLGALDFIEKPFDDEKLLALLDVALDLGCAQKAADKEIEQLYQSSSLPPDKLEELKEAQKKWRLVKKEYELRERKAKDSA